MSIYLGSVEPRAVHVGNAPVEAVYRGTTRIWPPDTGPDPTPVWDFYDDFERATLGSDWVGSGAIIEDGTLKKSTTAGSARMWINGTFDSDDLEITATIGHTQDNVQLGIIMIGSGITNDDYVMLEFSKNVLRARTWTGSFTTLATFGARPLDDGDTIGLRRQGTNFTVTYNGEAVETFTSAVAMGSSYRRVSLTVNVAVQFILRFYGPTFDDVGIRAH